MRRVAIAGFAVTAAALAAACGGSGGTDAYAAAFTRSLRRADAWPLSAGETRCFARRVVTIVGVDRLDRLGYSADRVRGNDRVLASLEAQLPAATMRSIRDELSGGRCFDLAAYVAGKFKGQRTTNGTVSARQAACIGRGFVTNSALRDTAADGVLGITTTTGQATTAELAAIATRCGVELSALSG